MSKYQVIMDLEADTNNLEVAYTEAERLIAAGASALGRAMPFITVAVLVDPMPRTATQFTVTVPCGPTRPGGMVQIAFDPTVRKGAVLVWDELDAEHTLATWPLTPESLRWLLRGLAAWPMDLIDDIAREDELKRRGGR